MTIKVGINGFGRIGRQAYKVIYEQYREHLKVEAINDLAGVEANAHLLRYDTIYGRFPGHVELKDGVMYIDGEELKNVAIPNPAELPWGELGVDIVLECTGLFRKRDKAALHLDAGAKKVIISAPGRDMDGTFCLGVNEDKYDPETQHIISNSSCTTNCLAPVIKVLHHEFGIASGFITNIHAVTGIQTVSDTAKGNIRLGRSAMANIIPTKMGGSGPIRHLFPDLAGKLHGIAYRVPVITGSLLDMVMTLEESADAAAVNAALKAASLEDSWLGKVLDYSEEPLVSSDYIGSSASATIDALSTVDNKDDHSVKIVAWYDNEWGYSHRLADLAFYVAQSI